MSEVIIDHDPDDETTHEQHRSATGLCASEWCDDAALPGEEYCRECIAEFFVDLEGE